MPAMTKDTNVRVAVVRAAAVPFDKRCL